MLKRCGDRGDDQCEEIPEKRRELESEQNGHQHGPSTSAIDFQIFPILPEELTALVVPLARFYAIHVLQLQTIGSLLKVLPEIPDEFRHLKRIKNGMMLVCPVGYEVLLEEVKQKLLALDFRLEFQVVEVPAKKPLTERQFEFAKEKWPTAFHSMPEMEKLLTSQPFNQEELLIIVSNLSKVDPNGCLIADGDRTLAESNHGHLKLEHAAIEAVRNLAQNQKSEEFDGSARFSYLATGCDVFLEQEPCAMCAMALVHARAKRVFFRNRSSNGVLTSGNWQLHLEPALNHHYQVFEVKINASDENRNALRHCGLLL